jgi:hypothetical protein
MVEGRKRKKIKEKCKFSCVLQLFYFHFFKVFRAQITPRHLFFSSLIIGECLREDQLKFRGHL